MIFTHELRFVAFTWPNACLKTIKKTLKPKNLKKTKKNLKN